MPLESVVANGGGKECVYRRLSHRREDRDRTEGGRWEYLKQMNTFSLFCRRHRWRIPRIVLYVAVDAPQNDVQYGGTVVAPVVKAMYEDILAYMDVEKSEEQLEKETGVAGDRGHRRGRLHRTRQSGCPSGRGPLYLLSARAIR